MVRTLEPRVLHMFKIDLALAELLFLDLHQNTDTFANHKF